MLRHKSLSAALLLFAVLGYGGAAAQTERSGGGGASQKIMQEYQQLASERTAMQAKLAQLQKDLDAAKADTAAIKKERDALKSQVIGAAAAAAQANAGKNTTEKDLEQSKQRMTELVAHFRETAAALKLVETDRDSARKDLSQRNAAFDQCALNNMQLYEINGEVLDRYEHVGLFTKASASEPFTKITRVRLENLVDDYRGRAQELRIQKRPMTAN
jgi:septal ring factor EnvC (AmiA/AmiB activator)